MQKEMFKNCRDYLEGRKDRKEFWEVQIAHEEIVLDKQLPLRHSGMREIHRRNYGGAKDETQTQTNKKRKDSHY